MMNLTSLACPKCGAEMRTYERSGIHVDQCGECRGIFLDRGELERLVDAEAAHYARERGAAPQPSSAAPAPDGAPAAYRGGPAADPWRDDRRDRRRDWDDDDDDWDDRRRGEDRGRRGGFLGNVFEMFD